MGITTGDEEYAKTIDWFNSLSQKEYDALATKIEKEFINCGGILPYPKEWAENIKNLVNKFKEKA